MERHALVRQHLFAIEQVLRNHQLWQCVAPLPETFESTQPFCMDTLEPHQWLQWVLIPRMHALIDSKHPLPSTLAIAPYYEMALEASHSVREPLLAALQELDILFNGEQH